MKYIVGDKVKVRSDLERLKYYGTNCVVDQMLPFCGKIVTIEKISGIEYKIEGCSYNWTDEMFEEKVSTDSIPDKTSPKYKIGDKVRVIENLCITSMPEPISIVPNMLVYSGKIVTISGINSRLSRIIYSIKEDGNTYDWPESILEPIKAIDSNYIPCVGDKVLIREDLISGKCYDGIGFTMEMIPYCNTILTITKVNPYNISKGKGQFIVAENIFTWSSEMVKMKVQDEFNPELSNKVENTFPEVKDEQFLIISKTKPKLFLI